MIYRNLELHNVAEVLPVEDGNGFRLSRLPEAVRSQVNPAAREVALHAAGCEIRLNLRPGASIRLVLQMDPTKFPWERGGLVEVYQGCFHVNWFFIGTQPTELTVTAPASKVALARMTRKAKLPFDAELTRIVLPYRPALRVLSIEGGEWDPPAPGQVPASRLLVYGTSLTHGAWSMRPTETYAMRLARHLGMDLVNLGFGGANKYDPAMAGHIAGRDDWDVVLLESHNLYGTVQPADYREKIAFFLRTIRQARPGAWIFATDLFMVSEYFPELTASGDSRRALRRAMKEAVDACALPRTAFIPIRSVFRDPAGINADLVHPSPSGMEEIARKLASRIRKAMAG